MVVGIIRRVDLRVGHRPKHVDDGFRQRAERRKDSGSCLGVVVRYRADEQVPRCVELVIKSDDPDHPTKCLEALAYTIWECCDDCKDGRGGKGQGCACCKCCPPDFCEEDDCEDDDDD